MTAHDPTTCPHCGADLVESRNMTDRRTPQPGDVTVCVHCRRPAVFADGLRLRTPTPAEAERLDADPDVRRAIRILDHIDTLARHLRPDDGGPPTDRT
jgi:hypothetical protein